MVKVLEGQGRQAALKRHVLDAGGMKRTIKQIKQIKQI